MAGLAAEAPREGGGPCRAAGSLYPGCTPRGGKQGVPWTRWIHETPCFVVPGPGIEPGTRGFSIPPVFLLLPWKTMSPEGVVPRLYPEKSAEPPDVARRRAAENALTRFAKALQAWHRLRHALACVDARTSCTRSSPDSGVDVLADAGVPRLVLDIGLRVLDRVAVEAGEGEVTPALAYRLRAAHGFSFSVGNAA